MSAALAEEIMACVHTMPAISPTATMAMRVIDDPKSSSRDVSRVILTDQVITAQLLRLANSPYYGASRRVTTVSEAITFLGFREVRSIIVAVALQPVMNRQAAYELHQGDLWQHSVGAAVCAQHLARLTHYEPPEEAFISGLVHDIGKVALGHALGERFRKVLMRVRGGGVSVVQAEIDEFGVAHDEVGGMVAQSWGLPSHLQEAIALHHRWDPEAEHARLAAIVHLSDYMVQTLGLGVGSPGNSERLDPRAIGALNLKEADLQEVVKELAARPPQQLLRILV